MKRAILLFLTSIIFLMGCSKQWVEQENANVPTITVYSYKSDADIRDADQVVAAINEYIEPLIQTRINVEWVPYGSYLTKINQLMDSNSPLDLFITSQGKDLQELYKNGDIASLNSPLQDFGADILDSVSAEYLQVGQDQDSGEYYGIVTCHDYASRMGIEYRADIAQKYGLDMENVHSLEDLAELFDQLQDKTSAIHPIVSLSSYRSWDKLGDGLGVLMMRDQNSKVVNLYETIEYRELVSCIREWYLEGKLYEEVEDPGSNAYYLRSDQFFGCVAFSKPGFVVQEERYINKPIGFVALMEDYLTTDDVNSMMWAISQKSQYKKNAMQFLNLLYSDPTVINLWIYGLEGVHYEVKDSEKKIIGFPKGVDSTNSGYAQFMGYTCGNQYLSYIWEGDSETIWQEMQEFNDNAMRSSAFGFRYDPSKVTDQVNACKVVLSRYEAGFFAGIYDIEEVLPQFQRELKDAGIDEIIAEKQRQLDLWLENVEG